MKKVILSVATVALCALVGCEKETAQEPVLVSETNVVDNEPSALPTNPEERPEIESDREGNQPNTFYDNTMNPPYDPKDYGCFLQNGECMNAVPITTGTAQEVFDIVFGAIESGNNTEIRNKFAYFESTLDDYIDTRYVTGVINGDYYVRVIGDWDVETAYMKFYDASTNTLELVHPFRQ